MHGACRGGCYRFRYTDIVNHCYSSWQAYSEAINLLNYSTVVIPVTQADKTIDKAMPNYTPLNDLDELNWNACMFRLGCLVSSYFGYSQLMMMIIIDDPEIYDGGPVGVQIVARKFEEEKVLAVGKIIQQILKTACVN